MTFQVQLKQTTCSHIFCGLLLATNERLQDLRSLWIIALNDSRDLQPVWSKFYENPSWPTGRFIPRAISFWQYQIHQENSFQQAVVRSVNDKNAQLQRQLENVVREANSEIELLAAKKSELERDLDHERKKVRELQEAAREQNKEYQKLKAQHDKIKRKALLGVSVGGNVQTNVPPPNSQGTSTEVSDNFSRKFSGWGNRRGNGA
ncbi:hypothetical protein H1R20_g10893, partial [Candolleomyces eurysporus]